MKNVSDTYNKDKDTARVRRHAARSSYLLSFAYLIFMFILSVSIDFPLYVSLFYPGVLIIGSVFYFVKKIPRKVYEYWFAISAAGLCALYSAFSGTFTIPLLIYVASLSLTAMFRDEKLILIDSIIGIILAAVCSLINYDSPIFEYSISSPVELIIIPCCILATHFALTSLVQRDKQLFLFAQQKNRNNKTLLQIVETKRSEAEAAAKVKTEFLANTSHEIRTPMNSIMGMVELALREDVSPQVREYLGNIRNAGTNLLNIINDILDFSKIESGKTELLITDYSILSIMNDICNITTIRIANSPVQLITCISPDVPALLSGDERRIKQIILNLVTNAVKYTRKGSITINVTAKKTSGDNVVLCCYVKDTGIGIRENDIKRLFNAFERADTKRNRNIEGTGLGLAICKSLAEMMGGKIIVESVYGKGSTFGFEIPQAVKDNSRCIQIKDSEKKNILLCIKDKEQLKAVSEQMKSLELSFTPVQTLASFSQNELRAYSHIISDYEECLPNRQILSEFCDSITVITDPGVRLPDCCPDVRKIYRPVTIITLLSIFSDSFTVTEAKPSITNRKFSAPEAKILVVDDNATNLLVAKRLISIYSVETDTAESGIQALRMVQQKDYDIVFMDHMMPELDGIETTQAIRSLGGKYSKLTIVALTANVISGAAELFRESGLDDFIGKPIEMNELNRILTKYIPEEKQIKKDDSTEKQDNEPKSDFKAMLSEIKGLNIDIALRQCADDIDFLKDILRSAATSKSVKNMVSALEKNDLSGYTIHVHGIKGALRNIGMDDLGAKAYELELAGKRNDIDFINQHHKDFIDEFNAFSEIALKITDDAPVVKTELSDTSVLKENLALIIDAAEDMDYSRAAKAIDILEKSAFGEKTDKQIQKLSIAINGFEFEEAIAISKKILEEEI